MMTKTSLRLASIAIAVFCFAWYATYSVAVRSAPAAKNLALHGDIAGATDQARQLLAALRDNNWDALRVNQDLLRLPEQQFAESRMDRGATEWSFYPGLSAEYNEVAFYSRLYARLNLKIKKGFEAETRPEGYFIVGWKDGHVSLVPVADVGMYETERATRIAVFPGMSEYRSTLPRWGRS